MSASEFQVLSFQRPGVVGVIASSRLTFSRHSHDDYGIGIIEAGAQRSASGRGQVEAGPGEIIAVNPGEIHDGAAIGDVPRTWRMIYFDPAVVGSVWRSAGGLSSQTYEFEAPAYRDASASIRLRELFLLYAYCGSGSGSGSDSGSEGGDDLAREERLLFVLSALGVRRRPAARRPGFPTQIIQARRLVDDDPAAPLTLSDLAQACGLSRFQTLRAFAKATGFTPHAYMMQRRIALARSLIGQGVSLVDAALASGFGDQSHMSRVFVRTYGYSPGAYAKAVR